MEFPHLVPAVSHAGLARWLSPETFKAEDRAVLPTTYSDTWSLGCTLFEVITGKLPYFEYKHDVKVTQRILSGELPGSRKDNSLPTSNFDGWEDVWELIDTCWYSVPRLRPSCEMWLTHMPKFHPSMKSSELSNPPTADSEPASLGSSRTSARLATAISNSLSSLPSSPQQNTISVFNVVETASYGRIPSWALPSDGRNEHDVPPPNSTSNARREPPSPTNISPQLLSDSQPTSYSPSSRGSWTRSNDGDSGKGKLPMDRPLAFRQSYQKEPASRQNNPDSQQSVNDETAARQRRAKEISVKIRSHRSRSGVSQLRDSGKKGSRTAGASGSGSTYPRSRPTSADVSPLIVEESYNPTLTDMRPQSEFQKDQP